MSDRSHPSLVSDIKQLANISLQGEPEKRAIFMIFGARKSFLGSEIFFTKNDPYRVILWEIDCARFRSMKTFP